MNWEPITERYETMSNDGNWTLQVSNEGTPIWEWDARRADGYVTNSYDEGRGVTGHGTFENGDDAMADVEAWLHEIEVQS